MFPLHLPQHCKEKKKDEKKGSRNVILYVRQERTLVFWYLIPKNLQIG